MALAAGISDKRLHHPEVEHLSRDTYLPRALSGKVDARLAAILLTAPEGAVASHRTAAALWGLEVPLLDRNDRRVDLTVPLRSRAESRADRRVYRAALTEADVARRRAMPVTTPARTWRDLAGVVPPAALLAVADQLLDGLCSREELQQQVTARPSGRGSARARMVLPVADSRAESPMESVVRWLLHEARLPAPVLQYEIVDGAGLLAGRADLAWPELKVLVEFDGDVHRERRVFVDDLRRQNRLIAAGWIVLRFSSADVLGRPEQVVAEIRRALRR
jgi:very-short-patch-repair endonuclease